MKIKSVEAIPLRIPFEDGSAGVGLMPVKWTHLDFVLVRVETENGIVGWGDGFAYSCLGATMAALRDMVAPLVSGREITDIPAFNLELQRRLHLHGRYGITMFAISAVDIALWDIAAKEAGLPLASLLSDKSDRAGRLPAYASLVRYGDAALVRDFAARAVDEGYRCLKFHEIAPDILEAGRAGAGDETLVATDVNCNWSLEEARTLLPRMQELGFHWVEEPVFPPDDAALLGSLQRTHGVSIASGENACTAVEFSRLAPEIRFLQPSVTKAGGVTEFLRICDVAREHGAEIMPHAPYFGPGYQATLHLMSARGISGPFEHFYVRPEAWLDPSIPLPQGGEVQVPEGPGLGFEPDPALLARYGV